MFSSSCTVSNGAASEAHGIVQRACETKRELPRVILRLLLNKSPALADDTFELGLLLPLA